MLIVKPKPKKISKRHTQNKPHIHIHSLPFLPESTEYSIKGKTVPFMHFTALQHFQYYSFSLI